MANAWLMRPGSSMIELQPYGFDEGPAHLQYPLFNMRVRLCMPACCCRGLPSQLCLPPTCLGCVQPHASVHAAGTHPARCAHAARSKPAPLRFFLPPYRLSLPQDNATGVLWWVLSVCDPTAFTPGKDEAAGRGNPAGYAKERNIVLR